MNRLDMPDITSGTIAAMEDMSFFTHSPIFDDLLIVVRKETNCPVLKAEDGLTVMDAIWPDQRVFDAIMNAAKEVKWGPDTIQKLVLTYGHVNHTGCGGWLVEQYYVDTYLSKEDEILWKEHPVKPDRPETWKGYEIDHFLRDGDTITLGEKTIYVYSIPGHTPGCLSYILPAEEDGGIHMAVLWGGTIPPWEKDGVNQYLKSSDYFVDAVMCKNMDVVLSNHTAIDNGLKHITYSRKRLSYTPNIYIIGLNGIQRYFQVFRIMSDETLKNQEDNTSKKQQGIFTSCYSSYSGKTPGYVGSSKKLQR